MSEKREIKTTLAIDGEKQFKAAMDDAYRGMKVLGSEMKLNTAVFGDNASSMEGLTKKGEILSKQVEQQKEIIQALSKAVEDSAASYGESDKRTDAYRIKLNNARAVLTNMEGEVRGNDTAIANWGKTTQQAGTETVSWNEKLVALNKGLQSGIDALKPVIAGIAAAGAAALVAGKQLFDLTAETGKWADELITTSVQTGVSTTALQEWGYAAQFIDTEVETMTGSMAKMIKQLAAAKEGTGASAEAFAALKVNITGANGQLLGSQEIFFSAIDALGRIANETERDALAMQIFGKSAQELNPLIQAGSAELQRLGAEAQKMGIIMGENNVAQLGAFDDKMNVFNSTITGIKNNIAAALTPAMGKIIEVVQSVADKFSAWLNSPAAQTLIGSLTDKIVGLASEIGSNLSGVMNTIIGAFETAGKVIGFVIENIDTITTVAITLTGVLATLKVAQLAVNIAMASNPIGAVITAVGLLVTAIVALAQNWDNVTAALGNAWKSIKRDFESGVQAIGTFVNNIIGWFKNLVTNAWDVGVNIVKELWEGIASKARWFWGQLTGWIGDVIDWLTGKDGFDEHSPSKVTYKIGQYAAEGLANGLTDGVGAVQSAMRGMVAATNYGSMDVVVSRGASYHGGAGQVYSGSNQDSLVQAFVTGVKEAFAHQGDNVLILNDREMGRWVRSHAQA